MLNPTDTKRAINIKVFAFSNFTHTRVGCVYVCVGYLVSSTQCFQEKEVHTIKFSLAEFWKEEYPTQHSCHVRCMGSIAASVCVGGGGDDCLLLLDPGLVEATSGSWHSSSVRLEDKLYRSIYWNIRCCRKSRRIKLNYFQPNQENPLYSRTCILHLNFCPHEIQIHCNSNAEHEVHPGTVTRQWEMGETFRKSWLKGAVCY